MCPWSVTKLQNLLCNGDYVIPWQVIRDTKSTNKTKTVAGGRGKWVWTINQQLTPDIHYYCWRESYISPLGLETERITFCFCSSFMICCFRVQAKFIKSTSMWIRKARLPCWLSRCQQVLHQRWIWGIHCLQTTKHASKGSILASKPRADVTTSPKQWLYKKDWCPQNYF